MTARYSFRDELRSIREADFETIWTLLEGLRNSRLEEFSTEHRKHVPGLLWKMGVTYQCLVRRTVETADGIRLGWDAGNMVTAATMARSLIETASLTFDLTEGIKKRVADKDLWAVDELVNQRLLGTRDESLLARGAGFPAANVLTLIDKLDKFDRKLHKRKPEAGGARKRYDTLSEYAHPNLHGVLQLYGEIDTKKESARFGTSDAQKRNRLVLVGKAFAVVTIVEICRREVIRLVPDIFTILQTLPNKS